MDVLKIITECIGHTDYLKNVELAAKIEKHILEKEIKLLTDINNKSILSVKNKIKDELWIRKKHLKKYE